jgi:hypothetical protein
MQPNADYFFAGVAQIAWSCARRSAIMVLSGRYLLLILAAGSGRPYSHRTFTSRMTVSTYPDWEFRDPRLCDEDLSRRPRSATQGGQQARQPRPGPSAGHRTAGAAAPGDALWPWRSQQAETLGEPGMKPQRPHADHRRPALLPPGRRQAQCRPRRPPCAPSGSLPPAPRATCG